ncbi:MAG TPA: glutamine synthetase family protein [Actinocrinis sp.]|nr:glutamine synthetase family protein [Actinocrinis sp.]
MTGPAGGTGAPGRDPDPGRAAPPIDTGAAEQVVVALPTTGGLKGKTLSAEAFHEHAAHGGFALAAYLVATDADMTPDPYFPSLGEGTGDLRAIPDPDAVYHPSWLESTALVLADAVDPADGTPVPHAPRTILRRQIDRLAADHGLTARLGVETEAYAYRVTARQAHRTGYTGLDQQLAGSFNGDYALDHEGPMRNLLATFARVLKDSRIPLETVKTEAGFGQLEVTYPPTAPLPACDRHQVVKLAARAVAEQVGMSVSFMAFPHAGQSPSGLHLHLSLTDPDGAAVFAADGDGGGGNALSERARHILAGCLEFLPEVALLYAPTHNSYKRYGQPFTTSALTWGHDNRSAALRITGHGANRRIEMRLAGADADAHLAAAALLAAVRHGLDHRLPLTDEPIAGLATVPSPARALPTSLAESAARFDQSALARKAFGDDVVAHYVHAATLDVAALRNHVTDWEMNHGFSRA